MKWAQAMVLRWRSQILRIEANDFTYVVVQAVAALFPEDPPLFLARTPHGHHDTTLIEARLRRTGFDGVTVETVAKKSTAPLRVTLPSASARARRCETRSRRTRCPPQSPAPGFGEKYWSLSDSHSHEF
jgi:hypothetical protein